MDNQFLTMTMMSNNHKKNILGICLMLCAMATAFNACSTDEDFFYQDEPRVRLVGEKTWAAGTDSVNFSFVAFPSHYTEKEIFVDAQIMGDVASRDRQVNLAVDQTLTTATDDQYSVPASVVIPSGQTKGTFAVTLKRDASLQQKNVRLYLKVVESADFKPGVNEENHIVFIWTDVLSKPNNWSELEPFFGTYSNVKYRFMLEHLDDEGELSATTMSWALLNSLRIRFQNALNEYNAAHSGNPLTDEYGNLVTFE